MKELPYFRFTCQEWDSGDISLENHSTKGLFVDICSYYWLQNCDLSLAKLTKKVGKMMAKSQKKATERLNLLAKSGIIKIEDGRVFINFLDAQLAEIQEKSNKLSVAGKKGVEARKKKKEATLKPPLSNKDKDKDKDKDNIGKRFSPPSIDQIREYKIEKNYNFDENKFWSFYESKGWYVGKNKMKSWKAACHTWHDPNFFKNPEFSKNEAIKKQASETIKKINESRMSFEKDKPTKEDFEKIKQKLKEKGLR